MPEELNWASVDELLKEAVTDDEVREILERLSVHDGGGSDYATVAAISETTGVPPEAIGRMLAEIRQTNLEERFGSELLAHEKRLESHHSQLRELEHKVERVTTAPKAGINPEVQEELVSLSKERILARQWGPLGLFLVLAMILVALMASSNHLTKAPPFTGTISTTNGQGETVVSDEYGKVWVEGKDGRRRSPTSEERASAMSRRAITDRASGR